MTDIMIVLLVLSYCVSIIVHRRREARLAARMGADHGMCRLSLPFLRQLSSGCSKKGNAKIRETGR